MSPDFHRHGLFHPRRSAVSQLAKAPSVVGRIMERRSCNPHTGFEPVALRLCQSRTTAAGGFIIFSPPSFQDPAACFSATPISAGERGRMGTGWGCGISLYLNAERAPCFSATPSIGTQNATAVSEQPPRPRSAALLSPRSSTDQPPRRLQSPSTHHAHHVHHFASVPAPKSSNATKI